jgi:hypothetical protein
LSKTFIVNLTLFLFKLDKLTIEKKDLIRRYTTTIVEAENSGIHDLLKSNKYDELAKMFKLFKPIKICHSVMVDTVSSYLRKHGRALFTETADNGTKPFTYIQVIVIEFVFYKFFFLDFLEFNRFEKFI